LRIYDEWTTSNEKPGIRPDEIATYTFNAPIFRAAAHAACEVSAFTKQPRQDVAGQERDQGNGFFGT